SGPTWFFDIDSLTGTMNYQPLTAGNQANSSAGFQDKFDAEKAGEEINQQYHDFDAKKPESEVILSPSSSAQSRKQDDKTKKEAKGKSLVESFIGYRDLSTKFQDFHENSSNEVNAAGTIVPTVGQNSLNKTNPFSAVGPSNTTASPTHGKSSFKDASQEPDDPNMPELEDITYSDDENVVGAEADFNNLETSITVSPIPTTKIHKNHHVSQIISDLSSTTQTRSMTRVVKDQGGLSHMFNDDFHTCMFACFLSQEEPKRKVWVLVDLPYGKRAIGTKWVYRNKRSERGIVVKNKARLIAQGHTQEEGIDYEEVFASVARIEAIRLFLAYASFMGSMVYQMDAPRAWYETLANYLLENSFQRGKIDQTLFIKKQKGVILQVQIYVDDIIFGLQIKQKKDGIFISQYKYVAKILKKFRLTKGKSASTPIDTEKPLLKDPDGEDVDVHTYRSMIGSLMYLTSSRPDIMLAVNDVTRLQALVDKKKVMVTEAAIREALRLDDVEGVDCLPNEEIFTELARMGYKKLSTKLTFYKAFFSNQWKFLIHTILLSMSAKQTSWNEFSSAMASAVICLSTGNLSTHTTKYALPTLTQKVFAKMRRVRKGFSRVETPLFKGMLVGQEIGEGGDEEEHVEDVTAGNAAQGDDTTAHKEVPTVSQDPSIPSPTPPTPPPQLPQDLPSTSQRIDTSEDTMMDDESNQGRIMDEIDKDDAVALMDDKKEDKKDEEAKVVENAQEGEPAEVQEVVDVVTTAKLITEVVTAVSKIVTAASAIIYAVEPQVPAATITIVPNVAGFMLDYFKGMSYDDIRPIFEAKFNSNIEFLLKIKEQIEEEENRALQSINETLAQKAAKRRKLNEEVEDLKRHLEIVPDEDDDDDVYTEATPLARKVPVVDYKIIELNNKPYYKIIRADGTHQLYISFLTLLKNFNREDLEAL
nr:hypothetical protein [Tanacetum cinerariifolium]